MDSINFVNLKSDHSDDGKSQSNSPDSLSQNAALNQETSFITQPPANRSTNSPADQYTNQIPINQIPTKRTGPSVLLKHSVSSKRSDDDKQSLQKSRSAPYLLPLDGQYSENERGSNGLSNNNCLTSTPNLFNSSNLFGNYDNILKLLQTPDSKLQQLIDGDSQTPSKPIKSADNQTASSSSSGLPPAVLCRNVSFDYRHNKVKSSNVLRNVNLNCQIGSIYGLLGPSGCGRYPFEF